MKTSRKLGWVYVDFRSPSFTWFIITASIACADPENSRIQQQQPSIYLPKQRKVLQEQNKFTRSGEKTT